MEWDFSWARWAKLDPFQVSIGVFFGLAVLSVVGRMVARVYTRRRLYLDDAFLIFGLVCLCAATVLAYMNTRTMFLVEAIQRYFSIVIPADQAQPLLSAMAFGVSVLCLTWTATFAVKFSFLVMFWHLIQRVSKWLTRYYWAVVATCVISWMFVICEPFILCQYFGLDTGWVLFSDDGVLELTKCSVKCFSNHPYRLNAALKGLTTTLDITTDIMSEFRLA